LRSCWWIAVLVLTVVILAAGAVTAGLVLTHRGPFDTSLPFDRAVWQDHHRKADVRLRMADWLVARHALDGKSRSEVISMLGSPNGAPFWPEWDLAYDLGLVGIGLDYHGLVMRLGQDGRVSEARVVQQPVSPESD